MAMLKGYFRLYIQQSLLTVLMELCGMLESNSCLLHARQGPSLYGSSPSPEPGLNLHLPLAAA